MKRVKYILLLFSITFTSSNLMKAQENYPMHGTRVILAINSPVKDNSFYVYSPAYKAKAIYKSLAEITNEYPEQLMSSLLSADNQEWYNANMLSTSGLQEKQESLVFERTKKMDREQVFYELNCKFQFSYQQQLMAIIKFYMHVSDIKTFAGAFVLQKVGNRWFKTVTPFTNDLSVIMIRFKTDKLQQIFYGKETGDKLTDELIRLIKGSDGSISIDKFSKEVKAWYKTNETEKLNYFKDPLSW